jgi:hypothetical protein
MRDVAVYDYPLKSETIESHHREGNILDDRMISEKPRLGRFVLASVLEN